MNPLNKNMLFAFTTILLLTIFLSTVNMGSLEAAYCVCSAIFLKSEAAMRFSGDVRENKL
jgi:hypothetical protein